MGISSRSICHPRVTHKRLTYLLVSVSPSEDVSPPGSYVTGPVVPVEEILRARVRTRTRRPPLWTVRRKNFSRTPIPVESPTPRKDKLKWCSRRQTGRTIGLTGVYSEDRGVC